MSRGRTSSEKFLNYCVVFEELREVFANFFEILSLLKFFLPNGNKSCSKFHLHDFSFLHKSVVIIQLTRTLPSSRSSSLPPPTAITSHEYNLENCHKWLKLHGRFLNYIAPSGAQKSSSTIHERHKISLKWEK
jgi:hypothetical protein